MYAGMIEYYGYRWGPRIYAGLLFGCGVLFGVVLVLLIGIK